MLSPDERNRDRPIGNILECAEAPSTGISGPLKSCTGSRITDRRRAIIVTRGSPCKLPNRRSVREVDFGNCTIYSRRRDARRSLTASINWNRQTVGTEDNNLFNSAIYVKSPPRDAGCGGGIDRDNPHLRISRAKSSWS